MDRYLEGKKLLLLGGSSTMTGVVKLAKKLGCIVYITDYYDVERSPAKLIADHYTNLSIEDYPAVVDYIKANGIDGVLTGFTDSYLKHYLSICEMAGLPHYGSEQSFGVATDKMLFKKACIRAGVGVIPGRNAYDFETVSTFAEQNGYPLILKPTDNSGSRGVIKCEKPDDLKNCYEYALSYSRSKNVIVERFMDCDSIAAAYQFTGTKAVLSAVNDRPVYIAEKNNSAITAGSRYPSQYLDRFIKEQDAAVKRFFAENGFRDGMASLMGFVDDKGFYMCEMCYRPSGGHHFILINDQNGVNGLALLIEFAVTGKTTNYRPESETPYFKDCCGMIHIIGEPEKKIARMDGVEEVRALEGVIDILPKVTAGQTIGKGGTTAQQIVSVWLKAKDWGAFDALAAKIKTILRIEDENGCSLIKD